MAIVLWFSKRRYEAILLASSVITASIVVYLLKMAVGRERPALWDTEWYWGSSFPSGHTLVFAAFATATVICIGRLWPAAHKVALVAGLSGVVLVGLSRLVLGVHWPTDVLAAACIGMFLPLAINVALEIRQA